jgi:hypothetical protein
MFSVIDASGAAHKVEATNFELNGLFVTFTNGNLKVAAFINPIAITKDNT